MGTLTETEISHISKLGRNEGLQRLGGHFSWAEFSDERRHFHQSFVYDVAKFAWVRGVPWPDVVRAAAMAKDVFPLLHGLEVPELLLLLGDALTRRVPNLTPLHRCQLSRYLGDVCVGRRQLLQAVVGGGACVPATQGHLEVQLPPMPLPLAQGTTLEELERRLGHKERQLCALREGSGVTLEVDDPEVGLLDREGVIKLVRAAVRTSGEKLAAVLHQEATMIAELLELKMQCTASATRGSLNPTSPKAPPQEKAGRPGKMTACQRVSKHNGAQPRRTARP